MNHIQIIQSKVDIYGNVYTAISVNGGVVHSISGGDSNVSHAAFKIFGDWEKVRENCYFNQSTLAIREFNRITKNAPYAGCSDDLVEFLRKNLKLPLSDTSATV